MKTVVYPIVDEREMRGVGKEVGVSYKSLM